MTLRAAKGTPQIFPAGVLRSRQESNAAVKAVFDATLQLAIRLQEGVQRRLILPNKRIDLFAFMPICPIREKLPDRNQKETGSPLQFQYVSSHPRPTSSTLMRRVKGRGFLCANRNTAKGITPNDLPYIPYQITSSLPTVPYYRITIETTWKKEENDCPFFFPSSGSF
jgi:hypothetical protein